MLDEIAIWVVHLARTSPQSAILSREEQVRAARFRSPADARRWRTTHCALRSVLAAYCHGRPSDLDFTHNDYGKPELVRTPANEAVHFNLSHSRDLALIAVAPSPIGVDVEYVDPSLDFTLTSRQILTPNERRHLESVEASFRRVAFFRLWARKEAYSKGRGLGLSLPSQSIEVHRESQERMIPVSVAPEWDDRSPWRLQDISSCFGYCAAVASVLPLSRICFREFDAYETRNPAL